MSTFSTTAREIDDAPIVSVVVIGRNEGRRLTLCFASIAAMRPPGGPVEVIYVDSGSSDDSVARATAAGVKVIQLQPSRPTAAAGRNAGWRAARGRIVLFLDGDMVLAPGFVGDSLCEFDQPQVAVVTGYLREMHPDASIFNRILDLDWPSTPGPADYCGGNALVRRDVLEQAGGFDESLIAGEEPDMCRRIRACGYTIVRVDRLMTGHDLAMKSISQYWRRAVRGGYACAQLATRYRRTELPLWLRESRHNLLHGPAMLALLAGAPLAAVWSGSVLPLAIGAAVLIALALRTAFYSRWKTDNLATLSLYGLHSHLQHIPMLVGQLSFMRDRVLGKEPRLIEYKDRPKFTASSVSSELPS